MNHLLSLIVAAPFLTALALIALPSREDFVVKSVALVGSAATLLGCVLAWANFDLDTGGLQMVEVYPLVPAFGIDLRLGVDGWGITLLLLTGIILLTGVLATWTLDVRPKEFLVLLLVLVTGVLGVFVSQDLFVFFLFYEIAVLPMYLLIGIWGSDGEVKADGPFAYIWKRFSVGGKEYAAMKLTLMLLVGSAAILVAMFAMYQGAGSRGFGFDILESASFDPDMQIWAFPLLWLGFGSLAGVFPFHTWSPDGHAAAPTAVSMLHAGVLMKLGAFGVIRVGMMMLPEGAQHWVPYVGGVAVLNIVYGAMSALSQKDLKYIIAYSSVSHMGVVMLGAATLTADGWNGAIYQMSAHGIMTGLFFALVGQVYGRAHTRWVPKMGGFARKMPFAAGLFTLAALSSLGLPATAGFVAEFLVFLGAWQSDHAWWAIPGIIGAFITAIYVLRTARGIFWGPGPAEDFHDLRDGVLPERAALYILGACVIVFGCFPSTLLAFIHRATVDYLPALLPAAEAKIALLPSVLP
ncbi:MAG: NADH-quinone oxidoreductase subunit M [Myxococcales bacterium]|nr:NADH-quinone oxidoreductase subunit M [Myxococcales bacterium]